MRSWRPRPHGCAGRGGGACKRAVWYANGRSSGGHSVWVCTLCHTENQAKGKACRTCRAARSYADVANSNSKKGDVRISSGQVLQFPLLQPASQAAQPDAQGPARAELSAHITSLEQALLCLPATESMLATKQNIENEIRETKRQITALRPLGAQLDSCRGAVRRATSRRDAAIAQVHAAQVAVSEADAELGADLGQACCRPDGRGANA